MLSVRVPRSPLRHNSILEWELARIWSGISITEWEAMDGDRQSFHVAAYKVKHQEDAILAHDQAEKAKAKHPKYGKK